ncbi:ribosome silencing factor [Sphingopyxis granuli]|uniref:Ribosomal silencing factor RsfS n=1 Tax=Sphingopyxis granuli TaxID=267128 RepID=A0AA86GJ28_9SPHN|nr:ribosome silencing factor [Sphingopyxis granuli]AMG73181.1 Ribosomal silencing factor RsfS [Sphingopyxis granuli]
MIAASKDAAPGAAPAPQPSGDSVDALHALILHQLEEDQAQDTISIPLAGKSSIADRMVIASGRSTRHVSAIADKLAQRIKQEAGRTVRVEGLPNADWVLIDAGDVIVHLFRPEVRSFYNLERMWSFGDAPPAAAAN